MILELLVVLLLASGTCYGAECLDRAEPAPPRNDWGYQSDYCTGHIEIVQFNETHSYFSYKPYCYI